MPSLCLSFPTGAGSPRLFHRRGARQLPGSQLPALPWAGDPLCTPAHIQLCTRVHTQDTRVTSRHLCTLCTRPAHTGPLHTQAHTLPARLLLCTRVCNHMHVQAHTRTQPPRSAAPTAPPLRPPQRLRGNAPDLSMEPLRENAPGEAEEVGGGQELAGTDGGQTVDRRAARGAVEGKVEEGAVCACKANVQAWWGLRWAHTCARGAGESGCTPHTFPKALPAPQSPHRNQRLLGTLGHRGQRGFCGEEPPSLRLVTAARDSEGHSWGQWQPEVVRAEAQEPGLSLLGPLPHSGLVGRG